MREYEQLRCFTDAEPSIGIEAPFFWTTTYKVRWQHNWGIPIIGILCLCVSVAVMQCMVESRVAFSSPLFRPYFRVWDSAVNYHREEPLVVFASQVWTSDTKPIADELISDVIIARFQMNSHDADSIAAKQVAYSREHLMTLLKHSTTDLPYNVSTV